MGLEKTFYRVSEDVGLVEVCAIVYEPNGNLACPISFPFDVSLSTEDGSAGIPTALLYVYMMTTSLHLFSFSCSHGLPWPVHHLDVCCMSEKKLCQCDHCR